MISTEFINSDHIVGEDEIGSNLETTTTTTTTVDVDCDNNNKQIVNWQLLSTSNPPTPRFDNTLIHYKNHFYLFGGSDGGTKSGSGFSTFLKLDLDDYSWQSQNCNHRTRVLHTTVVHQDAMYIFGGGVYEDERTGFFSVQKVFKTINEMLKYTFETKEWTVIENEIGEQGNGSIPCADPRDGHCSVVVGDEMFVIGGSKTITSLNKKVPISSLFFAHTDIFNFNTRTWRRIESPRFGRLCSAVTYQRFDGANYIYVFGGYDSNSKGSKDLWRLDLSNNTWKLIVNSTSSQSTTTTIDNIVVDPNMITERYGHTANIYQDKMYIYGGYSKKGFQRDFFSFDLIKEEWKKIEFNIGPPKRRRHNAILMEHQGKTKIFLYGGTYLSCLYNDLWEYCFPSAVYVPSDNLVNDFGLLYESPEEYFSDITFQVEDKEIHAHKCVLSVRSPYFRGLFKSGLKESFQREIKVQEKYEDFRCLIEFLYTGKESLVDLQNCIGLLYLSDLYQVTRLKTICESKATEGIDCESVIEIFQQADFYKLDKLRKICLSFIARHNKELSASNKIKSLDSHVLLEIIQYLEPGSNKI